jgi:hypothetical protein
MYKGTVIQHLLPLVFFLNQTLHVPLIYTPQCFQISLDLPICLNLKLMSRQVFTTFRFTMSIQHSVKTHLCICGDDVTWQSVIILKFLSNVNNQILPQLSQHLFLIAPSNDQPQYVYVIYVVKM